MTRYVWTPLFFFVLLVNPAFIGGCGTVDEDFTYNEGEMRQLLTTVSETAWTHPTNEGEYTIDLQLVQGDTLNVTRVQPALLSSAWACTERSFVRDAAACVNMSHMAVEGTITVTDADGGTVLDSVPVEGTLAVTGFHLSNADLSLSAGDLDLRLTSDDGVRFSLAHARW